MAGLSFLVLTSGPARQRKQRLLRGRWTQQRKFVSRKGLAFPPRKGCHTIHVRSWSPQDNGEHSENAVVQLLRCRKITAGEARKLNPPTVLNHTV